jgi:hypothetical protein
MNAGVEERLLVGVRFHWELTDALMNTSDGAGKVVGDGERRLQLPKVKEVNEVLGSPGTFRNVRELRAHDGMRP